MLETIQNILGPILTAIGAFIVAGGGLAAIVYAIFRFLSEKWLNAKFEERLAAYKHEQQKEIEQLRFKINALMDRTAKLHQREFDVLPEAWAQLNDAYWQVKGLIASLRSYPDVNRMTAQHLGEFLAKSDLAQWEQEELKQATDKTRYYIERISWREIFEAKKVYGKFQIYFLKNGIFIPADLKVKFSELDDLIRSALIEHEVAKQHGHAISQQEELMKLVKTGPELLKALEADVQSRLWNSQLLV